MFIRRWQASLSGIPWQLLTDAKFHLLFEGGGACGGLFLWSSRHCPQGNGLPCLGHLVALMTFHLGLAISQKRGPDGGTAASGPSDLDFLAGSHTVGQFVIGSQAPAA